MVGMEILKPVVVLIGWSLVMLLWMLVTRLPAMNAAGIDLGKLTGSKGSDADAVLPPKTQWKAHNYNHLMEQPTLFYAVAITLAIVGQGDGMNAWLGWGYVVFRILHSLVQATWNKVSIRFLMFLLASLCLMALTVHAALFVFHLH